MVNERVLASASRTVMAAFVAGGLGMVPVTATAQYFGQNKVQYQSFDFRTMHTKHFDLYYYPAESLAATDAARMAERWYVRHSGTLADEFTKRAIVLYADPPDFQQTNVVGGFISQGTGGVTEGLRSRVVLPFTGVYAEDDHVLGHELTHVFQYDIAGSISGGGMAALDRLPLWLIEGMAEYLSIGRDDPNTAMWLRDAARRNDLPTIKQLTTDPRYFPYRYGEALWAYIGGRWGDNVIAPLYRAALSRGWDSAVRTVLGMSTDSLSAVWLRDIRAEYLPKMIGRTSPDSTGEGVLKQGTGLGTMDVSPAISPDGKYVAFYTSRNLFSIDLFIADATTGKIVKKLTSPNRDPHFDAISFISSAGSFSPDGKQFAFVIFANGDNEIAIYDLPSGDIKQEIKVKGASAINDVAWGPNDLLAISGMHGGISDLYLYNLRTKETRQLTNDRYADLQPAWSPDGKTLAFATDSGPETDFSQLRYGPMQIGLYDVASGATQMVPLFPNAKNMNPQFSPDGRQLYFVSDRGGFDDIYRATLGTNEIDQLTHIATGVSGITALSPALSVASQNGRIMFSVFNRGGNELRRFEPGPMPTQPIMALGVDTVGIAGILPPSNVPNLGPVTEKIRDPLTGLEAPQTYETSSYKPSLSLEYVGGSAGVGVSNGPVGTVAGGGLAAYFGDMLGNQIVGVEVGGGGDIRNISGQVIYQNLSHRWNWSAGLSHVPYITGFAACCGDTTLAGVPFPVAVYEQQINRTYFESAQLGTQYPFSMTKRLELGAGYSRISFGTELDRFFLAPDGSAFGEDRQNLQSPPGLNLFQTTAAFVTDYSYFGFTSPVAGGRSRFEVDPTFGNLNFESVLVDYRRYFFARPFTFAIRGVHIGRYGKDAENQELFPLFLGDQSLIRGYEAGSFSPSDCPQAAQSLTASCPVIDRLIGSRLAVVNLEWRIPLLGTRQFGLINFPYLLTEIAPFLDAGVAWSADSSASLTFSRNTNARVPVFSAGVTTRFNLFGYLVAEVYWAYPFQRPGSGGRFGFQIAPGW